MPPARCLIIRNGRVIDPAAHRDATGDLLVRDGRIAASLSAAERAGAELIDASGLVVAPGLVDIHVHLREPGQTHKEDIRSGTRAAAAGGFTAVVCMPNTQPPGDNPGTIRRIRDACARNAIVNVYPTGCLTVGMQGEQLAPIGSLRAEGVVAVTDDGACVQDNDVMRRVVEYAGMFDLPVLDHCQDAAMTRGAVMHEGLWSLRLGLRGWPAAAEDLIVSRNVVLAHYTGCHIHMQHISSANAVDIVRRAKARGIRVSAEATPHHLFFTDADCRGYDTSFKMNPPLRAEADRAAIIEGVLDGTLDVIATDHAPHSDYEKDCEFDLAPFGIVGLETALAASLEVFYHAGRCGLPDVLACLTSKPAALLRLPKGTLAVGADADIVLFDPYAAWTVDAHAMQSKSANSPWHDRVLRGRVQRTIVAGRTVWHDGRITADEPAPSKR
jgi:dihydroorotase